MFHKVSYNILRFLIDNRVLFKLAATFLATFLLSNSTQPSVKRLFTFLLLLCFDCTSEKFGKITDKI